MSAHVRRCKTRRVIKSSGCRHGQIPVTSRSHRLRQMSRFGSGWPETISITRSSASRVPLLYHGVAGEILASVVTDRHDAHAKTTADILRPQGWMERARRCTLHHARGPVCRNLTEWTDDFAPAHSPPRGLCANAKLNVPYLLYTANAPPDDARHPFRMCQYVHPRSDHGPCAGMSRLDNALITEQAGPDLGFFIFNLVLRTSPSSRGLHDNDENGKSSSGPPDAL